MTRRLSQAVFAAILLFGQAPALGQATNDFPGSETAIGPTDNAASGNFNQSNGPVLSGPPQNPPQVLPQNSAQDSAQFQATDIKQLAEWFQCYDQIRRQAQLSPADKAKANALLSKGISLIVPGAEKEVTRKLLAGLVTRYNRAAEQMKLLPLYPETEQLHRGYYQYFNTAGMLFTDYLKVQNNILVPDATGAPLAGSLMPRKQNLEQLENNIKALDTSLRNKMNIAPYKYQ
ncbi:MAG: hypothetical protein K8F91_23970 [Candidatus Obscuribacterales bacterium]|nr:hypothetical protein [Candidatus Obscuribacterales bacterium]